MSFRAMVKGGVIERRLVLCMLLVAAACGKKHDGAGAGTTVGSGSAVLTLPAGTSPPAGLAVAIKLASELPEPLRRYSLMIGMHYEVVAVVDVTPPTATLAAPAPMAIRIDPARIPKGHAVDSITAIELLAGGALVDLPVRVFGPQQVDVTLDRGGTIMLLAPLEGITVVGASALVVRGVSSLVMKGDCTSWITPSSPRVAALAHDPAGLVIDKDHAIHLATKLAPGAPGDALHADDILGKGTADPAEASVVLASVLLAQGHSVRIASGALAYEQGGVHYRGVLQWAEVMLDGAPWFVDAREVASPRLVPMSEAIKQLKLSAGRTCAMYPPGASTSGEQWNVAAPGPAPEAPD